MDKEITAPWDEQTPTTDELETKTEREERKLQGVSADWTYLQIAERGAHHQQKSTQHILEFSRCAKALHDKCVKSERTKGGTKYTKYANDYWGLSAPDAGRYLAIGEKAYFYEIVNVLPPHYTTQAKLAAVDDGVLKEWVESKALHTNLSGAAADALITALQPPAPKKRKPLKKDIVNAERLVAKMYAGFHPVFQPAKDTPAYDLLESGKEYIANTLKQLSREEVQKAMPFVGAVLNTLNKIVETAVKETIPARVEEIEEDLRKREEELIAGKVEMPKNLMSNDSLKLIFNCLDPARNASEEQLQEARTALQWVYVAEHIIPPPPTRK